MGEPTTAFGRTVGPHRLRKKTWRGCAAKRVAGKLICDLLWDKMSSAGSFAVLMIRYLLDTNIAGY